METPLLIPAEFEVVSTTVSAERIKISLLFTSTVGYCSLCHSPSSHVHSHYQRRIRDLPISGKEVELQLCGRKFFCEQDDCPRKVFAQQSTNCLKPYARRLDRVTEQALAIGMSMGGRPGARLCCLTGLPLSASTILRVLKVTTPEVPTPIVLGVDDFAFRKGNNYGTILIDLEKRQPVDLLPDREGKTLESWLTAHPGITIVSRDRSSVYANAIRNACPQAIQVADRWHLLKNLGENTAKVLDAQRSLIRSVAGEVFNPSEASAGITETKSTLNEQPKTMDQPPTGKRYAKYQQVKQLQNKGHSSRAIARHLRMSRNTVNRYFKQETYAGTTHARRSNILEYESYLRQRWQEGQQCAKTLFQEIKAKGYNGGYTILAGFLSNYPKTPDLSQLPPAKKAVSFSSRSLSIVLCQQEVNWKEKDKPFLKLLLEKSPLLEQLRELNLEFKNMMECKKGEQLFTWCEKASQFPYLKSFAQGIRQDFDAVYQAMNSIWSNGQTEGQVNRLKNIKRQMYGRASFELLRIRVLSDSS